MQTTVHTLLDEDELVVRARRFDKAAIRAIIRQNNRRLFRIARSILKDDWEAEDAVQEGYLRAFTHIEEFEGRSSLTTWMSRIVINESLGRLRRRKTDAGANPDNLDHTGDIVPFPLVASQPDPERAMAQTEIQRILEQAIDALPDAFRVVIVARLIEDMSIEETAELFGLRPETVKTRLHRARKMLREDLEAQLGPKLAETFPFAGARCERMADRVIARLEAMQR